MEERGKPPYKISNGPRKDEEVGHIGGEQFSRAKSFKEALAIICDLTNFGAFLRGQYVVDGEGKKVVDLGNPEDVKSLRSLDKKASQ